MTTNNPDWVAATAAVDVAQTILIVTHVSPDGDAIGSMVGLAGALRERGKQVTCAVDGGVPATFRFIPGAETVLEELKTGTWDLMISVDASDEERSGLVGMFGRQHSPTVINLDHHPTNTFFGHIHLVQPEAASATQVVFGWLGQMGQPVTQPVALALLTGLVTDTIGFRTTNVTADTLHVATQLIHAGASLAQVMANTLESKPFRLIELWKHVLNSVHLEAGVVDATVTQADLKAVGMEEMTDGGLVSLLNTVNEARVAAIFKELTDGRVEISLRCKPGYDISQVAFAVGGGGHKQAAGATIDGPLAAARERILKLLREVAAG